VNPDNVLLTCQINTVKPHDIHMLEHTLDPEITWKYTNLLYIERDEDKNLQWCIDNNVYFLSDDELCHALALHTATSCIQLICNKSTHIPFPIYRYIGFLRLDYIVDYLEAKLPPISDTSLFYECLHHCAFNDNVLVYNWICDHYMFSLSSTQIWDITSTAAETSDSMLHNVRVTLWNQLTIRERTKIVNSLFWRFQPYHMDQHFSYLYHNFFHNVDIIPITLNRISHGQCKHLVVRWLDKYVFSLPDIKKHRLAFRECFFHCLSKQTVDSYEFANILLDIDSTIIEDGYGLGLIVRYYPPILATISRILKLDLSQFSTKNAKIGYLNSLDPIFG